ncbi:MAG TPA: CinA family nicotinamide mononucleotide deamidase-related protein [Verrucomicrobiales bacterium]|nr:CinA family nicotinamide mononucleotide deamidase-related protein [Verrucomicrobiales bacterium]
MRLELINTGTELLLGSTVNTHLSWLGENLFPLGLRIERQLAIPDGDIIRQALLETVGRADIVIVTGGLGPTSDDITREITAALLGLPLEENGEVYEHIRAYLATRKREMNPHTRRQVMVPAGSTVLHNGHGTAPGLYFLPLPVAEAGGQLSPHIILLPGPPRELHPMFTDQVAPILREITGRAGGAGMKSFKISGLGETQVSTTVEETILSLGNVELGYCARLGEVIVRVIGTPEQLAQSEAIIAAAFPEQYFTAEDVPLEQVVVDLLTRMGQWVSVAESCTGGCVANRITNVPGASSVLNRSFVTYANDAKTDLLGVPESLLASHGAVSREVAAAMATGCLAAGKSDHALALTGIAGPGGGSESKPVGTVYIALASKSNPEPVVEHYLFRMEREGFKNMAAQMALDLLRRRLSRMV